jgi:hypothetical protein
MNDETAGLEFEITAKNVINTFQVKQYILGKTSTAAFLQTLHSTA